jgi:hypothetical protein
VANGSLFALDKNRLNGDPNFSFGDLAAAMGGPRGTLNNYVRLGLAPYRQAASGCRYFEAIEEFSHTSLKEPG